MRKTVENQAFEWCWKIVESQGFDAHRKATVKKQTVEKQALDEIFYGFTVCRKNMPTQARPTPTRWHDFCIQDARFFYTFTFNRNNRKENRQILENQGFEALRYSLRWLYGDFTVSCTFAKNLLY